jgi:hypothetical protein
MIRLKFCINILILLQSATLFGQADYLIVTKGDTLRGQIVFQQTGQVEQATIKGDKRETFSAIYVREVFLKSIRYKPVQYDGVVRFMRILNDGYLSLLAFQPKGLMNYDGRLLQKRDGRVLEVPTLSFKKLMSNFLKDHSVLAEQISNGTLGRGDLDSIIMNYNAFIAGQSRTTQSTQTTDSKAISKLDLLLSLKLEVEKTEFDSKPDAQDMIADAEEKIKSNKPLPNYLVKALKNSLDYRPNLAAKLEDLLKSL